MSYNIHSGIGRDGKYSLDRIRDAIRVENPDFIALQEVDVGLRKSHFDDQPAKLAEELNYFP
ncbi:MAG: endonuclease, partial [Calditrichota bacterium]